MCVFQKKVQYSRNDKSVCGVWSSLCGRAHLISSQRSNATRGMIPVIQHQFLLEVGTIWELTQFSPQSTAIELVPEEWRKNSLEGVRNDVLTTMNSAPVQIDVTTAADFKGLFQTIIVRRFKNTVGIRYISLPTDDVLRFNACAVLYDITEGGDGADYIRFPETGYFCPNTNERYKVGTHTDFERGLISMQVQSWLNFDNLKSLHLILIT